MLLLLFGITSCIQSCVTASEPRVLRDHLKHVRFPPQYISNRISLVIHVYYGNVKHLSSVTAIIHMMLGSVLGLGG